jgi:hypothetical protein
MRKQRVQKYVNTVRSTITNEKNFYHKQENLYNYPQSAPKTAYNGNAAFRSIRGARGAGGGHAATNKGAWICDVHIHVSSR